MNVRINALSTLGFVFAVSALISGCGSDDSSSSSSNDAQMNAPANNATPGNATPGNATPGNATPGNATPGDATSSIATSGNATSGNAAPASASPMGAMCAQGFTDPCADQPATDANSICGAIVLPANYAGGSIRVSYHFFDSAYWNADTQTPLGPPSIFVWEAIPTGEMTTRDSESNADLTALKPCEAYAIRLPIDAQKWADQSGKSFYVYANVYMPMGGADTWQAKAGIDFVGASSSTIELGATAVNIEPIILTLK